MENVSVKTKKIVLAAVFASLCCLATMILQFPSPVGGYTNMGDVVVLLCAWCFEPTYAFLSAGIGSALADLVTGYVYHAPGTFIIKGLSAIIACFFYRRNKKLIGAVIAELFMMTGYFLYACFVLGRGFSAITGIPGNLMQGLCGIVCGWIIDRILKKNNIIKI